MKSISLGETFTQMRCRTSYKQPLSIVIIASKYSCIHVFKYSNIHIYLENYVNFSIFNCKIGKPTSVSLFALATFLAFIYTSSCNNSTLNESQTKMNENNSATTALTQRRLFEHGHIIKHEYALSQHLKFHCAIISQK